MCLLTYAPAGGTPSRERLIGGTEVNDDGHGFAIVAPDPAGEFLRLLVGHGLSGPEVVDRFLRLRARFPDHPALFHSRIGTSGAKHSTRYGCHPFVVGADPMTVLAHNGIISELTQPGRRSDTRVLAEDYLAEMNLDDYEWRSRFEEFLGPTNKVLILTVNSKWAETAYLFGEDSGTWNDSAQGDGCWYSNRSYVGTSYYTHTYGMTGWPAARRSAVAVASGTTTSGTASADPDEGWESASNDYTCTYCRGLSTVSRWSDWCRTCGRCSKCGCYGDTDAQLPPPIDARPCSCLEDMFEDDYDDYDVEDGESVTTGAALVLAASVAAGTTATANDNDNKEGEQDADAQ